MYDLQEIPASRKYVVVVDGRLLEVQAIGSINLSFFREDENGDKTTMCVKLTDVSVVESLSFNLFSTHAVSLKQQIMYDEHGATLQNGLPFAREEKGVCSVCHAVAVRPTCDNSRLCCFARIRDCPRFRPRRWLHAFAFSRRGLRGIIGRGIVLTGKLEPCMDCMRAKGRRGSVPRGPGARAFKPLRRVHLSLCGPLVPSLGGNLYLFVAVDSASQWNKVYVLRRKSDALATTKRLLTDVGRYDLGRIECFHVDNGTEWTRGDFRRFCEDNGIGIEFTPSGVPQHNGVVESAIWGIIKAGMAARRSAGRVFNVDFAFIPGLDERGDRLWMETAKWAGDALNQSATKANPGRRSSHDMFTGEQGPFRVLPFFQPGFMREDRRTKLDD
ncbi:unnamed protein product [Ectocarpus sp. CCAP 1310/34]|nr:unnamed protein product [Ectocarpus sp. CCAP 1310/34]